jgi:decorin
LYYPKHSSKSFAHITFVELGTNPLKSSGIENGAFQGMKKLSYIRIADTSITAIPQGDRNVSKVFGNI